MPYSGEITLGRLLGRVILNLAASLCKAKFAEPKKMSHVMFKSDFKEHAAHLLGPGPEFKEQLYQWRHPQGSILILHQVAWLRADCACITPQMKPPELTPSPPAQPSHTPLPFPTNDVFTANHTQSYLRHLDSNLVPSSLEAPDDVVRRYCQASRQLAACSLEGLRGIAKHFGIHTGKSDRVFSSQDFGESNEDLVRVLEEFTARCEARLAEGLRSVRVRIGDHGESIINDNAERDLEKRTEEAAPPETVYEKHRLKRLRPSYNIEVQKLSLPVPGCSQSPPRKKPHTESRAESQTESRAEAQMESNRQDGSHLQHCAPDGPDDPFEEEYFLDPDFNLALELHVASQVDSAKLSSQAQAGHKGQARVAETTPLSNVRTTSADSSQRLVPEKDTPASSSQSTRPSSSGFSLSLQQNCDRRFPTAFGIQYTIARLIDQNILTEDDIDFSSFRALLVKDLLEGGTPNIDASSWLVRQLHIKGSQEAKEAAREILSMERIWIELDREERALREGKGRGLGACQDSFGAGDSNGWYGGKIHFTGKILGGEKGAKTRVVVSPPKFGASCQVARKFGSRSFLRLQYDEVGGKADFIQFTMRPLVFLGRTWRAIYPNTKSETLIFLATNELPADRNPENVSLKGVYRPEDLEGVWSFAQWFAPLEENADRKMAKWVSRIHLRFSDTVPVLEFAEEQIVRGVPDIRGSETGINDSIMTDGCGKISSRAMKMILQRRGEEHACAVQARLGASSKGIWARDSGLDGDRKIRIEVRDSQTKVSLPIPLLADRAHRILSINTIAKATFPAAVSSQVIPILCDRKVPAEVFVKYMKDSTREAVEGFFDWNPDLSAEDLEKVVWGPMADERDTGAVNAEDAQGRRLLRALGRTGVMSGRLRRELGAEAKSWGFKTKDEAPGGEEHSVDKPNGNGFYSGYGKNLSEPGVSSEAVLRLPHSGQPASLPEEVYSLLIAGFLPQNCHYLARKLRSLLVELVQPHLEKDKWRITVPLSASGIIIPDPTDEGVLGEDEVYFGSPDFPRDTRDGHRPECLEGDVLVFRYPCYLPTDVRKVRAVNRVELRRWQNVIIFSTKGRRSLASLLSGGDYDGDRCQIIWDPVMVEPFENADEDIAHCPDFGDQFKTDEETVSDFLALDAVKGKASVLRDEYRDHELQQRLLNSTHMKTWTLGKYSNLHKAWSRIHGVSDKGSIELAHKVGLLVDASKSGKELTKTAEEADTKLYKDPKKPESNDEGEGGGPHVFDRLERASDATLKSITAQLGKMANNVKPGQDQDLKRGWQTLREQAKDNPQLERDLDRIETSVKEVRASYSNGKIAAGKKGQNGDALSLIAAQFASNPTQYESDLLRYDALPQCVMLRDQAKALCAYDLYWYDNFPWDVAFQALTDAKTLYSGKQRSVIPTTVLSSMQISKAFVRGTIGGAKGR